MTDFPFWLSDEQWASISSHLPANQPGPKRVSDRVIISGIVYVLKSGLPWRECPPQYGPYMKVFNRFNRWKKRDVWRRITNELRNHQIDLDLSVSDAAPAFCPAQAHPSPARGSKRTGLRRIRSMKGAPALSTINIPVMDIDAATTGAFRDPALLLQIKSCLIDYACGLISLNSKLIAALEAIEQAAKESGHGALASSPTAASMSAKRAS